MDAAVIVDVILVAVIIAAFVSGWRQGALRAVLSMVGVVAGLIVGIGTRLGAGCTSGHGVCGLSRLSPRSIVATGTFMATGIATVTLMRLAGVVS